MNQLTLRGFEPELKVRLQKIAEDEGISLNQAALRLMRQGAGLNQAKSVDVIGTSLDMFIGTMDDKEALAIHLATAEFDIIDKESWK
jgi:hypothetical protein